jgi:hypothetical protein
LIALMQADRAPHDAVRRALELCAIESPSGSVDGKSLKKKY